MKSQFLNIKQLRNIQLQNLNVEMALQQAQHYSFVETTRKQVLFSDLTECDVYELLCRAVNQCQCSKDADWMSDALSTDTPMLQRFVRTKHCYKTQRYSLNHKTI